MPDLSSNPVLSPWVSCNILTQSTHSQRTCCVSHSSLSIHFRIDNVMRCRCNAGNLLLSCRQHGRRARLVYYVLPQMDVLSKTTACMAQAHYGLCDSPSDGGDDHDTESEEQLRHSVLPCQDCMYIHLPSLAHESHMKSVMKSFMRAALSGANLEICQIGPSDPSSCSALAMSGMNMHMSAYVLSSCAISRAC